MDSSVQNIKKMIAQLEEKKGQIIEEKKTVFANWQKTQFQANQTDNKLEEGLLAYYQLNETESWNFSNQVQSEQNGRVNINLPPEIEKPQRVEGISGGALQFNGANFLSLGETGDFDQSSIDGMLGGQYLFTDNIGVGVDYEVSGDSADFYVRWNF